MNNRTPSGKNANHLNAIMESIVNKPARYRWCGQSFPAPCECIGCANRSSGLEAAGFDEDDWTWWVANNPRPRR